MKSRSRYHFRTPIDQFFSFSPLVPQVVNMHAKFEVYSLNRSRDKEGIEKFEK